MSIGSGTVAKTFRNVTRMHTTTRHGPPIEDVHIRRIWSLGRRVLIDECEVDGTCRSCVEQGTARA